MSIQRAFGNLLQEAVDGRYDHDYLRDHNRERLRNTIRGLNDKFASGMRNCGHKHQIEHLMDVVVPVKGFDPSQVISVADALKMVQSKVLAYGRGQELSNNYSHTLCRSLFNIQSHYWKDLAQNYVNEAYWEAERFLRRALHYVAPATSSIIWQELISPQLKEKKEALDSKVEELYRPFKDFWPCHSNGRYELFSASYEQRWLALGSHLYKPIRSHDQVACKKLLLDMLAYYDTALPTFVDNVISLGVETCLLAGLPDLITRNEILVMNEASLAKLAAEPSEAVMQREAEEEKKRTLESALDKLDDQPFLIDDYLDTREEIELEPESPSTEDASTLEAPELVLSQPEGRVSTGSSEGPDDVRPPSNSFQVSTAQSFGITTPRKFDFNAYADLKHQPLTPERTPARSTDLSASGPGVDSFQSLFGRTPSPASDRSRKARSRGSSRISRQPSNALSDEIDPVTGEEIL